MVKLAIEGGKPVRDKDNFLVFGSPSLGDEEINEVVDTMKSGWIGTGPKVKKFQDDFAAYKKVKHTVATNSCTAALHLSLLAAGIGPGDEVITTPMTFCATINAIIHSGAVPVLADCERYSMNIDPAEIEKKITIKTKAILPVHFAGRPCNMDAIMAIAKKYGLIVVEDCAHAIETTYKGKPAGCIGDFGCFSFYVTKNLVTGEGGMVTTQNDDFASYLRILSLHGMSKDAWKRFSDDGYKHYQVVRAGFKYNMTDIQASMGIHQLKKLEDNWVSREKVWDTYNEAFESLPCFTPLPVEDGTRHGYHLYTPLVDTDNFHKDRDWVLEALTAENIGAGVHYLPVHMHPFYQNTYGWKMGDYPNAEWIGTRTISLPLSAKLDKRDIADTVEAFVKILGS